MTKKIDGDEDGGGGEKQKEVGKEAINGKKYQKEEEGYFQCPIWPSFFFEKKMNNVPFCIFSQ